MEKLKPNQLVINIQPDEGISLSFQAKVPGGLMKLGTVDMTFNYADYFGRTRTTGYERLIYDAMCGDATLFQRVDMVKAGWKVIYADSGHLEFLNPPVLSELCGRDLGAGRGGRASQTGWQNVEDRGMTFPLPGLQQTEGVSRGLRSRWPMIPKRSPGRSIGDLKPCKGLDPDKREGFPSASPVVRRLWPSTACLQMILSFEPRSRGIKSISSGAMSVMFHPITGQQLPNGERALLSKVPVQAGNIHRIQGESPDAQEAAGSMRRRSFTFFT